MHALAGVLAVVGSVCMTPAPVLACRPNRGSAYYVLFAAMSGSIQTVVLESVMITLLVIAAIAGFKGSTWIIVGALAGHGVQDAVHGHIVATAGVPAWWPPWCLADDVGAAGGPDAPGRLVEKHHRM